MKIAIPLVEGKLSLHFGHCQQFALIEVDEKERSVLGREDATPPAHEPGVLPRWLHEQGAEVIISGGMGGRALQLFADNGIKVVLGAQGGEPEELVQAYLAGTLQTGENLCDH